VEAELVNPEATSQKTAYPNEGRLHKYQAIRRGDAQLTAIGRHGQRPQPRNAALAEAAGW